MSKVIDSTGILLDSSKHESMSDSYPLEKYFGLCDYNKFSDFKYFINKVNERSEYQAGLRPSYSADDPALGESVEYFHPVITWDDRMAYIMKYIVSLTDSDLSPRNKICNTIISHFYGGRGIHSLATRINDPYKAHVDFENYFNKSGYRATIRTNLEYAQDLSLPIYGSTELRTSLWGSANNYQEKRFGERTKHPGNIMDWVAGFIDRGIIDELMECNSTKDAFDCLTKIEGVGAYYGYHCATSNSVNPSLNWSNDEDFVSPGPGARHTLGILFPEATNKQIGSGDLIIWFRHNQAFFGFDDIKIHSTVQNISDSNGNPILTKQQNQMTTYGSEVGMCQYGIYLRLSEKPELIGRRKVARAENVDVEKLYADKDQELVNEETFDGFFG